MDDRTKLEKIIALLKHPTTDAKIRAVAQRMFDRMNSGNTELAVDPKFEEAYRRYAEAYVCVVYIKIGDMRLPKKCRPESICNHRQLRQIFSKYASWPDILSAMKRHVGCIGNEYIGEES